MIETKREVNYKVDWDSILGIVNSGTGSSDELIKRAVKVLEDRQHYFNMLRRFLSEIDALVEDANKESKSIIVEKLEAVFKRYDVHFVDIDDFERVNLDEPIKIEEDGK